MSRVIPITAVSDPDDADIQSALELVKEIERGRTSGEESGWLDILTVEARLGLIID